MRELAEGEISYYYNGNQMIYHMVEIRIRKNYTQANVAGLMNDKTCENDVVKIENSMDRDLTMAQVLDYLKAIGCRLVVESIT